MVSPISEVSGLQQFWFPVVLYAFVTSASPGPVNIVAASSGISYGVRRTLPQVMGATLGFSLLLFAVGLGLGKLFSNTPWLLTSLKLTGSLFLCYLAFKLWRSSSVVTDLSLSRPPGFWDGMLAQWTNPKAWIVAAAGVATYAVPGDQYLTSVGIIAATFLLVCFPCIAAWAVFGAAARSLLETPRMIHRFNIVMAILLLGSVVSLAL